MHNLCWAASNVKQNNEPRVLLELGNNAFNEGHFADALDLYTKSLELADQSGNLTTYTSALGSIGNLYCLLKNYDRGAYYYNKGYKAAIEQEDQRLQYMFLLNMLMSNCYANNKQKTIECYQQLQELPKWEDPRVDYYNLVCKGCVAMVNDDLSSSLNYNIQALNLAQDLNLGKLYYLAQHEAIGTVYQSMNQLDSALVHFMYLEEENKNHEITESITSVYSNLSQVYLLKGDTAKAMHYDDMNALLRDSLFYSGDMNKALNRLFSYEKRANDNQVMSLHKTINFQTIMITIFGILILALIILTFIVIGKNKSLNSAYQLLINRNKENISQLHLNRQQREEFLSTIVEMQNTIDLLKRKIVQIGENKVEKCTTEGSETEESANQYKNTTDNETEQRSNSGLSAEQKARLLKDIDEVMSDTRFISDPEFNLNKLAKLVESNTKYVSQVINETYNKNFKTYLNEFRIQEASRRMLDPQYNNLTISAIGEMVGFNSHNTFIVAFKKIVGMTPSVYQKLAANNQTNESKAE